MDDSDGGMADGAVAFSGPVGTRRAKSVGCNRQTDKHTGPIILPLLLKGKNGYILCLGYENYAFAMDVMDDDADGGMADGAVAFRGPVGMGRAGVKMAKSARRSKANSNNAGKPLKKIERVRTDFRDSWIWSEMQIK